MIIRHKVGITNAEALKILVEKAKKRELTPEQQQAHDFLKDITKLSVKDAEKLKEELAPIGLKEEQLINILNILPTDEAVVKLILREEKDLKKETSKKILDAVAKYA
jgi:DNA-directed RNA polymerase subunit F